MLKVKVPAKGAAAKKGAAGKRAVGKGKGGAMARRSSMAPALKPAILTTPQAISSLKAAEKDEQKRQIQDFLRKALGAEVLVDKSTPHQASSTKSRSEGAADVATAAKEMGLVFVLKQCGVIDELQRMLFPQGDVHALLERGNEDDDKPSGLKPSASALSLASMDADIGDATTATSVTSNGTDANRGKTTPPNAREGSLLIIRALCEIVGRPAEPYIVGAFLAAALDECGSNSTSIRGVAEDTTVALIKLAHAWAFPAILCPLLLQSLKSSEWRVKHNALERLELCASTAPDQVNRLLPKLIPAITNQVWDTKAQVSKAAGATLLAICMTGKNPDVASSIPAVVKAISKPSETNKAVSELMGTTFVVPVDAPTLSILCPVLSRALKEKLAIHKRSACIVISNMSRLVETPSAVAPFGPLLVPELKRVATNVQFEEIRDEALKALSNLTKALGESYQAAQDSAGVDKMTEQMGEVDLEQKRIQEEKDAEAKRQEEIAKKEAEEKRKFKEAMDAQRELDRIAREEADKNRKEEEAKREKQKLSTKSATG
ncbi:eIF-2-alpha kinase activator GCN1 [Seminavis robusta]|uniref:EIF-2-alpha kinase activator GCN1 n=1 Tax=Seminavis robusta TaxID=568900 RepID=A0A9N8D4S4_9STRA|nr:eIF-2-alpha kinase activator GCN1 [Seminavis robusta]|eukprot:Sro4_g003470.1 eIF-2-alpha kinase activator GCN1 (547) ;mRNA; f:160628-162268